MRQFVTIAVNAFMELVRQPIYLLLMTFSSGFCLFLSVVPYFGLGDDPKLVKDSVLAVTFLVGLFGAVISASASVAHEIRTGTALAVLAKPVGRAQFILAKYAGLAGAITMLTYVNLLAGLLAGRAAFTAHGDADWIGFAVFLAALALAYLWGGFSNYFLQRSFVADAVFATVILSTLVFVLLAFFVTLRKEWAQTGAVDWRMVQAGILILFALFILAGIALVCSTRMDMIPTLAICSGFFLVGLMSDYLFGTRMEKGETWAWVPYTLLPNWQQFWMADALETGRTIPWSYVARAFVYCAGYLGACLALALMLFEDRELS